jgi:hypothetical protein
MVKPKALLLSNPVLVFKNICYASYEARIVLYKEESSSCCKYLRRYLLCNQWSRRNPR